jgi:hypothetical protein
MIDWRVKTVAVVMLVFVMILITHFVKKEKITVRYAIIWYLSLAVLIIFSIFPEVLGAITKLAGFVLSSNFLFVLLISFLFIICISLTIIVSEQKEQIRKLIQEVSILKKDKHEKK